MTRPLWRSFLFVPADNERLLASAVGKPADVVMSFITDAGFISAWGRWLSRGGGKSVVAAFAEGGAPKGVIKMLTFCSGTWAASNACLMPAGNANDLPGTLLPSALLPSVVA